MRRGPRDANRLLGQLQDLGGEARRDLRGRRRADLSSAARKAAHDAPGHGEDAAARDEIAAETGEQTVLSGSYLVLISVTTVPAAATVAVAVAYGVWHEAAGSGVRDPT
ncbi:hypothetical protein [Micromonospora endolithica]|uniref:Uncharacterized protein n=1 Tax=Micromonospora endolithica TaxID=230091 RepID=A0A3A9ZAZ9_9ACTN|nr:hypothetical protein [Micromonospora endolithica]RKN45483.1 hypothetical protein D7223_17990 [Micromonospora endolithica]TWJ22790.1 hypothetical protein JD76_02912 [Micromonospora endolithica]